jgi:hypothetical protein
MNDESGDNDSAITCIPVYTGQTVTIYRSDCDNTVSVSFPKTLRHETKNIQYAVGRKRYVCMEYGV